MLTYELVCGHEPFGSADQGNTGEFSTRYELTAVVQSRICRVDVRYPEQISEEAKSFMSNVCHSSRAMLISATGIQSVVTSHALFNTRTAMDSTLSQTPIIVYAHTLCVKRGRPCRTDPLLSLLIYSSSHSMLIALDHPSRHASLNRDGQDQSTQGVVTANHAGWWTGQDPCRPAKTF